MSLELLKDGKLQGWVVATAFSALTIVLLTLGFFLPCVSDGWVKFGARYETIYISSLVIWLGYRGIKGAVETIHNTKMKIAELNGK